MEKEENKYEFTGAREFLKKDQRLIVKINATGIEKELVCMVDTGSTSTVIDITVAEELEKNGFNYDRENRLDASTAGGMTSSLGKCEIELKWGPEKPRVKGKFPVLDLNRHATFEGATKIDVILGADVMRKCNTVIDFGKNIMYFVKKIQ